MRYSPKRSDNIQTSSKTLGSRGNSTEATMTSQSSGSESSSSRSPQSRFFEESQARNSVLRRNRHRDLMDELQEKVDRMNALSNKSKHQSPRPIHRGGSPKRSLSSGQDLGGSVVSSGGSSGGSVRRKSSSQRKIQISSPHARRRRISSSSSHATGASRRVPRDEPPSIPSRKRRPNSPVRTKEPLKWTSQQSNSHHQSSRRRSQSQNAAGSANGSFQVSQRRNISLSSTSSSSRDGRKARSAQWHSATRDVAAVVDSEGDPHDENISNNDEVPGAFNVHGTGEVRLLSSSHHRISSISLDDSFQSPVSSLSTSHRQRSPVSSSGSSPTSSHRRDIRIRRSFRHRPPFETSNRSSSSHSSLRSWPEEEQEEQDDDIDSCDDENNTTTSHSVLRSVTEGVEQHTAITASAIEDIPDELEEARAQGRRETLTEVTRHNSGDILDGNNTTTSHSVLRSVTEEAEQDTAITASAIEDFPEELEEARAQGRQEALTEVTRNNSGDILVASVSRSNDEDSQDSEVVDMLRRRKILCWIFLLCFQLLVGMGVSALLFLGTENEKGELNITNKELNITNEEKFLLDWKGIIAFTPPTQEQCDTIANGLFLEDQTLLIHKCFHMQIDITLASDSEFGSLSGDLVRHIQQTLLPIMAGCQSFDFVDATIVIGDGTTVTNATGAIANGQIQEGTVSVCEADPIGNCNSFKLILDLYLDEDRSDAILVETIGKTVTSVEIANALGPLYPVQGVSDLSIVPVILPIIDGPKPSPTHT